MVATLKVCDFSPQLSADSKIANRPLSSVKLNVESQCYSSLLCVVKLRFTGRLAFMSVLKELLRQVVPKQLSEGLAGTVGFSAT